MVYGYQSIEVKYIGPTNVRGSRMKAIASAGNITVPYDYSTNEDERVTNTAKALIKKLGWDKESGYEDNNWALGWLPNGHAVFTRVIPEALVEC